MRNPALTQHGAKPYGHTHRVVLLPRMVDRYPALGRFETLPSFNPLHRSEVPAA